VNEPTENKITSWAAHPSKFCGSHDVDGAVAFKVLHRGEWVYPDDVDLD
jgi:hypothetical protein